MRLRIVTPEEVCVDAPVARIVAEGPDGAFGMLPQHIDFVSQLVPGILVFQPADGPERYAGIDEGTLVKCADDVLVSTRSAVVSDDLDTVREAVGEVFRRLDEEERSARAAIARLEAEMVRLFRELETPA